jgi:hypothetical protein
MTNWLSNQITITKDWIDNPDLSNTLITSWVRMLEERLNNELRVKEMIKVAQVEFVDQCSMLPNDWLEFTYVRYVDGLPLHYITPDEYSALSGDTTTSPRPAKPSYTIIGSTVFLWPAVDATNGVMIEIGYYAEVPPLIDGTTADQDFDYKLIQKHPKLYTYGTLANSAMYLTEDERAPGWDAQTTALIQAMNNAAGTAKNSGSPLRPKMRSFG